MKNRKAVRTDREDEKSRWSEWEVINPLDNLETAIIEEEIRRELAKILGPKITKRIEQVLNELPPNEAFIVLAVELLDMSYAELAACLCKTENNIRKTYSQGKRKLREKVN